MISRFRFMYEPDWRTAPMAFWVHVPSTTLGAFEPAAPPKVPRLGYSFLKFEFGEHELVFSSPAQLQHMIDVLSKKPLPTSTQLSAARGASVGPNGHWLSRLPAELKSPKTREVLVRHLKSLRKQLLLARPSADHPMPVQWPTLLRSLRAKTAV
jgi:hypothetical protein